MNRASGSLRRSSSIVSLVPEDARSLETTSTYSSPVPTTAAQGGGLSAGIGLGISNCGMETSFDHLRIGPTSEPFSMPAAMSNRLAPADAFYNLSLNVEDFSDESCYEIYNGRPDASDSPLSLYDSQAMSTSPSYNSAMEFGCSPEAFLDQASSLWATTPCSEPTTSSGASRVPADHEAGGNWGYGALSDTYVPVSAAMVPVMNRTYPPPPVVEEMGNRRHAGHHSNPGRAVAHPRSTPDYRPIAEAPSTVTEESEIPSSGDVPLSASGLECPVCGYRFTRRSNCKEHQKRHDPSSKRSYPCDKCHRSFSRNTDLRRHTDSVHHKLRRYVCDRCDRRFSRQEALTRHLLDCDETPRRASTARQPTDTPFGHASLPLGAQKRPSKRHHSMSKR